MVLNFAKARGWRTGENPAHWRGHLDHILPGRRKVDRGHHPALPYAQMPRFVSRLQQLQGGYLDEVGLIPLKELHAAIFKLSEGTGNNRLAQNAALRETRHWDSIFQTSGNDSISSLMREASPRQRRPADRQCGQSSCRRSRTKAVLRAFTTFPTPALLPNTSEPGH
jgi:hypothetical protein